MRAAEKPWDSNDTSEISTGSSTDFKARERARVLEAERLESMERDKLLRRSRQLHESLQVAAKATTSTFVAPAAVMPRPAPAAAVPASVPTAPAGMGEAMSTGGQAFDFGLIIAFPVIIATLGLFFVFPLIRDQIAAGLPPVPDF